MMCGTKNIRYIGRWFVTEKGAVATAPGSHFYLAFKGKSVVLHFETEFLTSPPPHLWISVDDGTMFEVPVDRHLRIQATNDGDHIAHVILKSSITFSHRWYAPLTGRIELIGWDGVEGSLPDSKKKTIEFIGDSITEGVFADEKLGEGLGWSGRVYQDDVVAAYAWQTAQSLGLEPIISAYGGLGVTQRGASVPKASDFYLYCFDEAPISYSNADYIVLNFGANDREHSPSDYITEYSKLLKKVYAHNPKSKLIILQPFCGAFTDELSKIANIFMKETGTDISVIKTEGWIPKEPLHPSRETHKLIAEKLQSALSELSI